MNSGDNWYGTRLHDEQVSVTFQGPNKGPIWGPKRSNLLIEIGSPGVFFGCWFTDVSSCLYPDAN